MTLNGADTRDAIDTVAAITYGAGADTQEAMDTVAAVTDGAATQEAIEFVDARDGMEAVRSPDLPSLMYKHKR